MPRPYVHCYELHLKCLDHTLTVMNDIWSVQTMHSLLWMTLEVSRPYIHCYVLIPKGFTKFQRTYQNWERRLISQFSTRKEGPILGIDNFSGTRVHKEFLVPKHSVELWQQVTIKISCGNSRKRDFFAIFWGHSIACFLPAGLVVRWLACHAEGRGSNPTLAKTFISFV